MLDDIHGDMNLNSRIGIIAHCIRITYIHASIDLYFFIPVASIWSTGHP
jgi:hypothetical protein